MRTQIKDTDVLVIGAGAAASRAALESALAGAKTLMVTKGRYGLAGTSCYKVAEAAGFSASGYADIEDNPEIHKADILDAALGTCSEKLADIVAKNAPKQVTFLESLGLEFQKFQGGYLATKGCFASCRRSLKIKGHGKPIVDTLKAEIYRQGNVEIWENSMALRLIIENKCCVGAFILNEEGTLFRVNAGAVILGTGGAGQLFSLSLNPTDVTGDGYSLAYLAGAKLVNMEFMQAGFGVIKPAKTIFNAWIWSMDPIIMDETGNDFINRNLPNGISIKDCAKAKSTHYPFSSRDISKYLEISVKRKYNEGGEVFADLRNVASHIPKNDLNLQQMWPITNNWMKQCGIDTSRDILQIVCYAHAINGGVLIDENSQSSVPNLYAVGEVAGGPHGADRLGGNMFSSGQVFGEIAGRHAAKTALSRKEKSMQGNDKLTINLTNESDIEIMKQIRTQVQSLATKHLLIIRTKKGLEEFCAETDTLMQKLLRCRCSSAKDVMYLEETKNLIRVGKMMASAALMRTESRGSHYRDDYPEIGGNEWRCTIMHQLINDNHIMKKITLY